MQFALFLLCIIFFLAGCNSVNNPELPIVVEEKLEPTHYHIVQKGDTVGSIVEKYGMTRKELITMNGLFPPYQLTKGQKLIVKRAPKQSTEDDIVVFVKDDNKEQKVKENTDVIEQKVENIITEKAITKGTEKHKTHAKKSKKVSLIWPIADARSRIVQHFDETSDGYIVFKAPAGTPVKSIASGTVLNVIQKLTGDLAEYKKAVIIEHENRISLYAHLGEIKVKQGEKVHVGKIIGTVGKYDTFPQLVFQLHKVQDGDNKLVDPEKELP